MESQKFKNKIWSYYKKHKRSMPWRDIDDPYKIVVSEIMLQQTQVSRVMVKYPEFIKEFPNFKSLAKAPASKVLKVWQGMGYNRRALALKKLSEIVMNEYKGKLPRDTEKLQALPGIGKATAGSIAAFAFNLPVAFIETNIRRVYIHFFFPHAQKVNDDQIIKLVESTLPQKIRGEAWPQGITPGEAWPQGITPGGAWPQGITPGGAWPQGFTPREWYYALMDYGTMLAKQVENPNKKSKSYRVQSKFEGSNREMRGKILKTLLAKKSSTIKALQKELNAPLEPIRQNLIRLHKEGFISKEGHKWQCV